jgi:2-succinyl-5-enolpyruvyl-6-hydroxy-3-cyclohexene-1-carboxylate synthase
MFRLQNGAPQAIMQGLVQTMQQHLPELAAKLEVQRTTYKNMGIVQGRESMEVTDASKPREGPLQVRACLNHPLYLCGSHFVAQIMWLKIYGSNYSRRGNN